MMLPARLHARQCTSPRAARSTKCSRLRLISHAGRRCLTISCRGSAVSREDLYRYTNGSFLANQAKAFDRRYLKFNLDELCSIASRIGSISAVKEVEKMEGGFSKALLMKKIDGTEVVAKLPFKIAGPAHYTTASEVAILQYVRQHTNVPVPRVLAWNSDATNAVKSEYIVMEKAPGVQLFKVWGDMPDHDQFMLVKNLCILELELARLKFPAHGSLYLRQSLQSSGHVTVPLDASEDPEGRFCIGPTCGRLWHEEGTSGVRKKGPWVSLAAFGEALAEREIARLENNRSEQKSSDLHPKAEQIALLQLAREVATRMSAESLPGQFASPTLWHSDLHLGNIYVSEEDRTKIVSIIDWQSLVIQPLLCQVRFPEILELPEDYEIGGPAPSRPVGFDEMKQDERMLAIHEFKQVCMARAYEAAFGIKSPQVCNALLLPSYLKDFFERCGEVSEEGATPLRACLIELAKDWEELGCAGKCPVAFTVDDLARHELEFKDYSMYHDLQAMARKCLGTDSEGWLAPAVNIHVKRQQNKDLLQMMMDRSAEYGKTPEEVRKIWPF
ncbi:uncharacterized protein MYCGRDRAFT_65675 [Zymoseptoria tritici IPO323]|uniref:Altered inheritance of mitochondria protein 9, mitochondrial n=1 Tax=Zymoseptoria tritici (strain CBS 115943 / IPO323) TaxID=336722 RepID=F9WZ32_ZYMTI|nr:uncharacterized protein MYCGRDRAFT_65675 [Zymoseptoria tritici IPO323]EGP91121.1 hypothetical protein MYCGRDRAFT_65675 [Zymoseptoria tritici IPO323]